MLGVNKSGILNFRFFFAYPIGLCNEQEELTSGAAQMDTNWQK